MNIHYLSDMKQQRIESAIENKCGNTAAMVILQDDTLVYETYRNGFETNNSHHVTSVTKSVMSALIGIAIDKGYIKDVNQPVLSFFEESAHPNGSNTWEEITLHHLLSMTCPFSFEDWKEPLDKLCASENWTEFTFDIIGDQNQIGSFKYSSAGAHLLSAILTSATGLSALEFANKYLFKPSGMSVVPEYSMDGFGFDELFGYKVRGWVHDPEGHSTGGWGLTLTVQDMARFGQLYLNGGGLGEKQIISQSWIEKSTAQIPGPYGYLWWQFDEPNLKAFAAMGDGGNIICCIPSENLVIAMASTFDMNSYDRMQFIREDILPLIIEDSF